MIGMAVLVRHHAHDFLALHLGAKRAAHAAVGAGRGDAVLGLTFVDQRVLRERGGGAGLHAGAAGNAFGFHEGHVLTGRDGRVEAAPLNGERERALLLIAGAHAARADDALARIEGEVRIARVLGSAQVVGAVIAVPHLAQAHHARHVLQLTMAVRRARSSSPGGDRKCTAPSHRGARPRVACSGYAPSSPAPPAWCRRQAVPSCPRSAPGTAGRSRTPRAVRWRRAWGS